MNAATTSAIQLGGIQVRFLLDDEDTGGQATAFETHVPAGAMVPPPHSHDGFEETVYGLTGVTTFTVDGDTSELGVGDALCIRRGQVHHFVNRGATSSCFLSVATPGVFGPDYFLAIAGVLAAAAGGPPDVGALVEVMQRHGLRPAAPVAAR